ncbi:alpha/beta hydrolase [Xenorhabdus mauleonii]|uniref:Alpha/beta hydrolase n=1 Tax=Xenorhabdus mauleonii TaxID=351675 RepID=A0A1I3S7S4_9GAMM|nr:alpha/beta hydrolase [Xenorhabdus mauleonii]PHM39087.1 alpha/beta hydrolase [Xenorhabdus mauleonii]SFJ54854.1 Platelet-activating factor acetylhydrolase, isoform II [Xenorhabdus mauleonii]
MQHTLTDTLPDQGCGVAHYCWNSVLGEVSASLWYPAFIGTGKAVHYLRVLQAQAEEGAIPSSECWPLVIMSHGAGGSRFDQYYLAECLAARGFAVLTVDHRDIQDGQQRWRNLLTRPLRLTLAQQALRHEVLAENIDFSRPLLIGHSAGAYDVLVKCGCTPRFELEEEFSSVLTELAAFDSAVCRLASPLGVVLMAPALSNLFPSESLSSLEIPALIISADQDGVRMLGTPADYAARLPTVIHHTLSGAGHYAFVHENPPILQALNPVVSSGDVRPRKQLHEEIINHLMAFCDRLCHGELTLTQGATQYV